MTTLSGGEVIATMPNKEGVEKACGIIVGIYSGSYSRFSANEIEFLTPRHETTAAQMTGRLKRLRVSWGSVPQAAVPVWPWRPPKVKGRF